MQCNGDKREFEVVIGPQKYKFLENDFYKARLCEVHSGEGKYQKPIFIFRFEITEGKESGCWCNAMINQDASGKRGKLWQLVKAVTEKSYDVFDSCNLKDLVGKECFIHVEKRANGNAITEYISLEDYGDIANR